MRVIQARAMGMCFGVRDALELTERWSGDASGVAIHGELVHNEQVLARLAARGFRLGWEGDRQAIPAQSTVMITAHGVSDRERARLAAAGKHLIDTTCPLVARAHEAAKALAAEGRHVLVIGRAGHVEVCGLVGDLPSYDVVGSPEEARRYPHDRLGIVCQTTAPAREVTAVCAAIEAANPQAEIRFVDTVCRPTRERQQALDELLEQPVDAIVVVGGRNSNNTRKLVELCRERGVPALQVQQAADLDPAWVNGYRTVGLTAGTSTPDDVIDQVRAALERL